MQQTMEVTFAGERHPAYYMRGQNGGVMAITGNFKFQGQRIEDGILQLDPADMSKFTLMKGEDVIGQGQLPRDHPVVGPELDVIEKQARDAERAYMAQQRAEMEQSYDFADDREANRLDARTDR
jgi:hypothetical protein